DADPYRPTLRRIFSLRGNRGLGELIEETYFADLARMQTLSAGVGDWVEVLRGQQRSGDLILREGEATCIARFVKGSLVCLVGACPPTPSMPASMRSSTDRSAGTCATRSSVIRCPPPCATRRRAT